jgi:O-antigen/teichoic acid export membrane protein
VDERPIARADGVTEGAGVRRFGFSLPAALAPFGRTLGTTAGLVVAIILNSGTGFVFWWMAARLFPREAVGLAGAAVSAMLLLSQIAVLGLGTQLAGVLHRERRKASLVATALVASALFGAVLGVGFGFAAPLLAPELSPLSASLITLLVFVAGVSLSALSSVLDNALVSVFMNVSQLARNAVFSFGRLGILLLAAAILAPTGMVIYGAWTAGIIVSLVALFVAMRRFNINGPLRPLMWVELAGMARNAFSHHVTDLSRSSSVWLLPLLVTVILSPAQNASFYVAMLIANFIAIVGKSATFTLYLVGAREPEELWRHMRLTLGIAIAVSVIGTLVLTVLGAPVLRSFGNEYASAYPAISLLALSCIPLAIKDHWIAIRRVQGTIGTAAIIGVALLLIELAASAAGAILGGLTGLALARLVVLALQSLYLAPLVYRGLFRGALKMEHLDSVPVLTPEETA